MKCHVRYIGVVDKLGFVHSLELTKGVNIITGKSSTGKSAMIEIFDYCMGSSDFTVPEGVITNAAHTFFVVLALGGSHLVLARKSGENKGFLKQEDNALLVASPLSFDLAYFSADYFFTLADFRKEIGRYFGLVITDVDEVVESKLYKGVKSPAPSVRSFTSFMLQHQNLVANKHAIFYRFDEKEKQEQAIDHFPIFIGYADQKYFLLSQQLNTLLAELRRLEQSLPKRAEERKQHLLRLEDALSDYAVATGFPMLQDTAEELLKNPTASLAKIRQSGLRIDGAALEYTRQRAELDRGRSLLVAQFRQLNRQFAAANASVQFAERYRLEAAEVNVPKEAAYTVSECPFCHTRSENMEKHANSLHDAIEWLNGELRSSTYLRQSFESDRADLGKRISNVRREIAEIEGRIAELDEQIEELKNGRPIGELAIRAKVRAETVLDDALRKDRTPFEDQIEELKIRIKGVKRDRDAYEMDSKLLEAGKYIEAAMNDLASGFDFEDSYKPLRLRFSLKTFELWHEKSDGSKVPLRAMGSGANWLYCHITLFLALHKLFCYLNGNCKIPPILFLDQPTQVYFPSVIADDSREFEPKDLAAKAGKADRVDEDMKAVENMFSQIVKFCEKINKETGIEPQIIIADHADKLKLSGNRDFESLVRARWRTRGFIDLSVGESPEE